MYKEKGSICIDVSSRGTATWNMEEGSMFPIGQRSWRPGTVVKHMCVGSGGQEAVDSKEYDRN